MNVRSRRPFDFKGFEIAGNIRGSYNEQSDKVDPIGNLLITDRWDTGIGEIGALLNFAYTQSQYRNAVRYESNIVTPEQQGLTVATPGVGDDFRFPDSVGNYYSRGKKVGAFDQRILSIAHLPSPRHSVKGHASEPHSGRSEPSQQSPLAAGSTGYHQLVDQLRVR